MIIHIGLCADKNFALPLGVCITSIFESHKSTNICVHILTPGLLSDDVKRLKALKSKYGHEILIHKIDDSVFDNLPVSTLFPKAIYYRYLFASILTPDIDKILYIDCDAIVLDDLAELYSIDLNNHPFAAAEDRSSDEIIERNRIEIYDGAYFNSGVLLLNLKFWRENDSFRSLITYVSNNPKKCLWPDQDALNILYHNEVLIIPPKYNFLISFIEPFEKLGLHKKKWAGIVKSIQNITILHFATKEKPWFKHVRHPLKPIWIYYYRISLWRNHKLKDPRSIIERFIDFYKYRILGWNRYPVEKSMDKFVKELNTQFENF